MKVLFNYFLLYLKITSKIVQDGPKLPYLLDSTSQIVVEIHEIAYVSLLRFEIFLQFATLEIIRWKRSEGNKRASIVL